MGTSSTADVSLFRPDLGAALEQFSDAQNALGMVGLRIAPPLEVAKRSGSYGVIPLKQFLKTPDTRRAEDGSYNKVDGTGTPANYAAEEHGIEERVDESEADRLGEWWDAEALAFKRCRGIIQRAHNSRVITAGLAIATTTAAGVAWTTPATADPQANILAAKKEVWARTGLVPNALCISWLAWEYLQQVDGLQNLLKYSGHDDPKKITPAMVAAVLNLQEIIISGGVINTANEAQAATVASAWDDTKALLFVKNTGVDMKEPQLMRTFHYSRDGSDIGAVVESYYDPSRRGDIVRSRMDTQEKVVYAEAGEVITGITA